ncbi:30S ribosomal protein S15 [Candidatus Woesearchaeota archaeon]|nr:30S ribosomal protein S15 [Candidatus Woesearchaeota archaeon]
MARMHSRKRGKSGSKQPIKKVVPTWLRYKPKEVELLVVKLAKEGKSPSAIGLYLRDTYGIPDVRVIANKKINMILQERKLASQIPEDLTSLMRKAVLIQKHMTTNKKDTPAKRGLQLTEAKINRLAKYYKRTGKLPQDWKYDPEKAKIFVE